MPKRGIIVGLAAFAGIGLLIWLMVHVSGPVQAAGATPSPVPVGNLLLDTRAPGATGYVNRTRVPDGQTILLPAGVYPLVVSAPGYETVTQTIEIQAQHITRVRGELVDTISPEVDVFVSPAVAYAGRIVRVMLRVQDTGGGLSAVRLALDGTYLLEKQIDARHNFEYALPLGGMAVGLHQVKVQTIDTFGNNAKATAWFEIQKKPLDISRIILPGAGKEKENDRR